MATKQQVEYLSRLVAAGGVGSRYPKAPTHLKVNGNVCNACQDEGYIVERNVPLTAHSWYTEQVITDKGRQVVELAGGTNVKAVIEQSWAAQDATLAALRKVAELRGALHALANHKDTEAHAKHGREACDLICEAASLRATAKHLDEILAPVATIIEGVR